MTPRRAALAAVVAMCLLGSSCTSDHVGGGGGLGDDPANTSTDTPTNDTGNPDNTVDTSNPPAELDWAVCDDPSATDEELECATLSVPLDHDDPTSQRIDLALVRVPAQDQDDRVGAVLTNPGGPGGSGFDFIAQSGTFLSEALGLTDDFDLIGFDPRGVDRSNGIRCLTDAEVDATVYLDDTPDTPEEESALDDADQQFTDACLAKYGDSLADYSTDATARDMDAIRAALGDDQISYLGISYGTYLGATYATLFPDRVRAMVLDAAYEPTGDTVEQQYTTQLVGFERAFDNWVEWCEQTTACAFRADDVGAAWDALEIELDANPVVADDGRLANEAVFHYATISALYTETDWPNLADALAEVRDGDPDGLFSLADSYIGRSDDGTYDTIEQSGRVIRCASGIDRAQPEDAAGLVATLQELAPRFTRGITVDDFTDSCATLMPDVTANPLSYDGEAPILVVGGTNDPATPFRWAEEMDAALGGSSRLVTYTGEGHGAIIASTCVTELEAATLVDLDVPDDGTVCEPDPDVARPDWWGDLPVPDGVSEAFEESDVNDLLGLGPTIAYSELRTSASGPTDVLDAYDAALDDAGFDVGGRAEPAPGLNQGVYFQENGDLFSVLTIGPDSFEEADLGDLTDLLPEGQTLVVLLALPN